MHETDRLELDPLLLLEVLQELEHGEGEVAVVRRGAKEPLEAALRQRGRRGLAVHVRHAVALGDLARRRADAGKHGPDERRHLLLGDEPLGLGLAHVRLALVVHDDEPDLGAAESRQPLRRLLHSGQVEVGLPVVELHRHSHGGDGIDADLGQVAAEGIDGADHDFLGRLRVGHGRGREHGRQRQREQANGTSHRGSSSTPKLSLQVGSDRGTGTGV